MKINKNQKIGIGVLVAGIFAYIAFKKGVFGGASASTGESTNEPSNNLPIVDISSGSETPQVAVVNIPPQFGAETAFINRLPTGAFQTFN